MRRLLAGMNDGCCLLPADGDRLFKRNPTCKNLGIFEVRKVKLRPRATNYSAHLGCYPQVPFGVR
jgi:hypothetical protein